MKRTLLSLGIVALVFFSGTTSANVVLTTPEAVRSELGGSGTVSYDQIRTISIQVVPATNTVIMQFEIFASSDPALPPYRGTYRVDANISKASLEIPRTGFETAKTLNPGQVSSVVASISAHVVNVETSMTQFGMVDGTQQP